MRSKHLSKCMDRLKFPMSASAMKYPIGKSIFAVNLPLKLFRATVANADIGSLKDYRYHDFPNPEFSYFLTIDTRQ